MILPSECISSPLELIVVASTVQPPIEAETNLALPVFCIKAKAVACVVSTPAICAGTCIAFADTVPNI